MCTVSHTFLLLIVGIQLYVKGKLIYFLLILLKYFIFSSFFSFFHLCNYFGIWFMSFMYLVWIKIQQLIVNQNLRHFFNWNTISFSAIQKKFMCIFYVWQDKYGNDISVYCFLTYKSHPSFQQNVKYLFYLLRFVR